MTRALGRLELDSAAAVTGPDGTTPGSATPAQARAGSPADAALPVPPDDDLADLIGALYDAAPDPASWPKTLGRVAEFTGGRAASLLSKDSAARTALLQVSDGAMDPQDAQRYFTDYARLDVHNLAHCLAEVGQPLVSSDLLGWDDYRRTRVYQEWVGPSGLVGFVGVAVERSATSTSMFGVFRSEEDGFADARMHHRMALLGPHLRRAVLVGQAMERTAATAAFLADTLDGLGAGVFLVDDEGRVAHGNASGQEMLAQRSVLGLRGGRLTPRREGSGPPLRDVAALAARGDAGSGGLGIDVTLDDRDGETHVAHVLPLAGGARRPAGARYSAAAAVFVRPARMEASGPLRTLAERYGLTPSEVLRQADGPGSALVGDAGYFKDPITALGITDALRDAAAVRDGTGAAFARYQEEHDDLSRDLFEVSDQIASFAWDLGTIPRLLERLNSAMKAEAAAMAARSPDPVPAMAPDRAIAPIP